MQARRPQSSSPELLLSKAFPPIKIATPTKPITNPRMRRKTICSPGINRCAKGRTMSGIAAMLRPVNPAETCCCPQLISIKGRAVLKVPITNTARQLVSPLNRAKPRQAQIAPSKTEANPIRPAASQKGVIPSRANLISGKVPPQTNPSVAIISQYFAIRSGIDSALLSGLHKRGLRP